MKKIFFLTILLSLAIPLFSFAQNYSWPLIYDKSGSKITLAGKVDKSKYTTEELKNLSISLYLSKSYQFKDGEDPNGKAGAEGPFISLSGKSTSSSTGVDTNTGNYFFILNKNDLSDNTKYYYSQVFKLKTAPAEIKASDFHTDKGTLTQAEYESDFEKRSYRLLAPFPGLSIVYDPDLCRELLREGKVSQNDPVCNSQDPSGFNNFLNYIFKLLIGFAAVLLVIKLIISGYQYAVTDVPFLKSSAKTGFFTSLFGLLLALSAYLILNTINPKLVSNTVSLSGVAIGVQPGSDGLGTESESRTEKKITLNTKSGGKITVYACKQEDMVKVNAFGTSFFIHKSLLPSVQRIDAKWRQLNPAYKIPLTVADKNAMGGYVCRNTRGQSKLSYHAYGLAIDINPTTNPMGSRLVTDMPNAFIRLWKDEGWGWGGDWTSVKDAMHFSKGKNEGGNMTVD